MLEVMALVHIIVFLIEHISYTIRAVYGDILCPLSVYS